MKLINEPTLFDVNAVISLTSKVGVAVGGCVLHTGCCCEVTVVC